MRMWAWLLSGTAIGLAAWTVGTGPGALLYVLVFALAAAPGVPLGLLLFGRHQPAGWIAGALIGYTLAAFGIWFTIALHVASAVTILLAWMVLGAAALVGYRVGRTPLLNLPSWGRRETAGLGLVLLLTLVIATPPLSHVGLRDHHGNRLYRAYFTADFVWHTALTAELTRFSLPPTNPYLAPEPIHYYWTYFLVPAAAAAAGPSPLRDVQRCLKVNAMLTGLLLMAAVFVAAWAAVGQTVAVTIAVMLALTAASAEGTYELLRLWSRGEPLSTLRDINIDAVTAWHFQGHRIDGLPRCLWYVPQHSMAYALGLFALTGASVAGGGAAWSTILLVGLILGCATALNPFVGGIFALVWSGAVLLCALRSAKPLRRIGLHAMAALPVGLAVVWVVTARMVEGAGDAVSFGLSGASLHAPGLTLLLSLGPVLMPVLVGAFAINVRPYARALPAVLLSGMSLVLMYLVRLRVDPEWVPFRAAQMLLVVSPALIARGLLAFQVIPGGRWAGVGLASLCVLIGAPTTVIDAYNAGDITNTHPGPGFRWTLVLSPEEQQAFAWIRRMTPPTAVVQMEPTGRQRDGWSMIPTFAERRMAAGLPISLLRVPAYAERSALVRQLYATEDVNESWRIATELGIDYVYVDALDRQRHPGTAKFDVSPQRFARVFRRAQVGVYQVVGRSPTSKAEEGVHGDEPVPGPDLLAFGARAR